jgi:hypothetical protein
MRWLFKFLPIVVLALLIGTTFVGPNDAASNLSNWAHRLGFDSLPTWFTEKTADNKLIVFAVVAALIYVFFVWLIPAIFRKKQMALPNRDHLSTTPDPGTPFDASGNSGGEVIRSKLQGLPSHFVRLKDSSRFLMSDSAHTNISPYLEFPAPTGELSKLGKNELRPKVAAVAAELRGYSAFTSNSDRERLRLSAISLFGELLSRIPKILRKDLRPLHRNGIDAVFETHGRHLDGGLAQCAAAFLEKLIEQIP